MLVTQKCQYALRALFELARQGSRKPIKIAQIADRQAIPYRFLEVILSQLKQGGFVESRRGTEGGYRLALAPREVSVGDVVRFIDGHRPGEETKAAQDGDGARAEPDFFSPIWEEARRSVFEVFDGTTLASLVERDQAWRGEYFPNYEI